jgi:predicted GIY-YIG superfamily endonuclease
MLDYDNQFLYAAHVITESAILALPRYSGRELPAIAAVYFAITADDRIAYIGSSVNLKRRHLDHNLQRQFKELGCAFAYLEDENYRQLEVRLIDKLKPELNRFDQCNSSDLLQTTEVQCCKCKYKWIPRIARYPRMCPNCKSRYWQHEQKAGQSKEMR